MELLIQPSQSQLGDILISNLQSAKYDHLSIAVAFAKNSGVLRLRQSLETFKDNGGTLDFYVGVDMNGTSYEALSNLFNLATNLYVIHDGNQQTFHTKLFNFSKGPDTELIVGSHNLTAGGLWTNYEASLRVKLNSTTGHDAQLQDSVDDYLKHLRNHPDITKKIQTQSTVRDLLKFGYVDEEVKNVIKLRNNAKRSPGKSILFGKTPRAKLPQNRQGFGARTIKPSSGATTTPAPQSQQSPQSTPAQTTPTVQPGNGTDPTLWVETRKMTGASRNILDLSKTALLIHGNPRGTRFHHQDPKYMSGAVEFFGIDPDHTKVTKDITINFEGTDYFGNSIKYPPGPHANHTWRLQLKGISSNKEKITTKFRELAKGPFYLPQKILAFTRVRDDYYYLTVFDDSDLQSFRSESELVAYNGRSKQAKLMGIL